MQISSQRSYRLWLVVKKSSRIACLIVELLNRLEMQETNIHSQDYTIKQIIDYTIQHLLLASKEHSDW